MRELVVITRVDTKSKRQRSLKRRLFYAALPTTLAFLIIARGTMAAAQGSDTARLSTEAAVIYKLVKQQRAGELKWQQIPWLTDLPEAIRQARVENRPILLWVAGDDPLERC